MVFENCTVLITGAAGHLGRQVVQAFAEQGARLALLDRQAPALATAFGAPTEQHLLLPCDLLDQSQVNDAVAQCAARFGRIDVLCNLAGGFSMGQPVHKTDEATWRRMDDLNVQTLLHMTRAVVPRMLAAGGGKIVNVGAFAALKGAAHMGAYVAAKAAVIRLTETMALELREGGINVNCVLPTILDTPDNRAAMPDVDPARWVALEDLAQTILFLASPAARAIHGAALPVCGLS